MLLRSEYTMNHILYIAEKNEDIVGIGIFQSFSYHAEPWGARDE